MICTKRNLQIAKNLSRCRVADHSPLFRTARGFGIQIGFKLPQIVWGRLFGMNSFLLFESIEKN